MKGVKDAFARLSGTRTTTVNLQTGVIRTEIDPAQAVTPASFWHEVRRVGFTPERMEVWVRGTFDEHSFGPETGARWPLKRPAPTGKGPRVVRLRVVDGGQDPPTVEEVD